MHRQLDVTADTTFDHLDVCVRGVDWTEEAIAVLDIESPQDEPIVRIGLEADPGSLEHVPHHADYVPLTPDQARTLAEELENIADAADRGETIPSRRR